MDKTRGVSMAIYGYARVSTKGQEKNGNSLEAQEVALREKGATIIYKDAFTGTTADRPEFDKLKAVLKSGDTLMVTKLDRIARSASQGIQIVDNFLNQGVCVNILNMGTMDNTANGKLIRNIMFAFAEFERDMIVQRTMEGKAIARTKPGFREGRPQALDKRHKDKALELLKTYSYSEVSEMVEVSKRTLMRYKKESGVEKLE